MGCRRTQRCCGRPVVRRGPSRRWRCSLDRGSTGLRWLHSHVQQEAQRPLLWPRPLPAPQPGSRVGWSVPQLLCCSFAPSSMTSQTSALPRPFDRPTPGGAEHCGDGSDRFRCSPVADAADRAVLPEARLTCPLVNPSINLVEQMTDCRLEGIVLKDRTSKYRDGTRAGWSKVKDRSWYEREAWRFDRR